MAEETAESSRIANGEEGGLEASTPTQEPVVTKRRRGRPRKSEKQATAEEPAAESAPSKTSDESETPAPKRRRGRPRKTETSKTETSTEEQLTLAVPEKVKAIAKVKKPSTRTRVKKKVESAESDVNTADEQEAQSTSPEQIVDNQSTQHQEPSDTESSFSGCFRKQKRNTNLFRCATRWGRGFSDH